MRFLPIVTLAAITLAGSTLAQDATDATRAANDALRDYLPFADETDFANATRGQIATLDADQITAPDGTVIYDIAQFDFLQGDRPRGDELHPGRYRLDHRGPADRERDGGGRPATSA